MTNFSQLVYGFDKKIHSKEYLEKIDELEKIRSRLSKTSSLITRLGVKSNSIDFSKLQEKEAKLWVQLYSIPKPIKLEKLINTSSLEKNLESLQKLGKKSKYFSLLKSSIQSSLEFALNSVLDKLMKSKFALQDLETRLHELNSKKASLNAIESNQIHELFALKEQVLETISFFEKESEITKNYKELVFQEIEKIQ